MLHFVLPLPSYNNRDQRLIEASAGKRTSRVIRNGKPVWIKQHDCDSPSLGRRLHVSLSSILPAPYLRATPLRSPAEMSAQEIRKIIAFKKAGLLTPDILYASGPALMLSDTGDTIQTHLKQLQTCDPHLHDGLLIQCAEALGNTHAAGLCHGRPHPRDMFLSQGKIGFFDFEEEPEAVMPLSQAQARDTWLLFFQICTLAQEKERTPNAAFTAWRRHISLETLEDLRRIIRFFRIFIGPLRLARLIWLGSDGKRMLSAMEFFASHLGI